MKSAVDDGGSLSVQQSKKRNTVTTLWHSLTKLEPFWFCTTLQKSEKAEMDSYEHPKDWGNKQSVPVWDLNPIFRMISLKKWWFSVLED